ncbi:intracellular septation protein A [Sphingomonas kaistensis]|uniref:Intracellular septation protein A n=1 Tax=Sphingomonas kaistensis TaxID=298708 RepID=A0A7X6BEY0_9SPHN|nr:septation protein IspZ [Sphingomonas kaistensis]NJC04779.1 intracellular septation protein A [Sphingomonas kaistensis]
MTDAAMPAAPGRRLWLYKRPFSIGVAHECWVLIDSRMSGLTSTLVVDGEEVASDVTPVTGAEAVRNHRLAHTLPDGRRIEIEAGYVNWWTVGIAVRLDGTLIHESHKGRRIAYPERFARMVSDPKQGGEPAYDPGKLKRNKIPIAVDIATGLLFFLVAKLTDLKTAALVGAAVGLGIVVLQRFVKVDLVGGMMLFGVFMLLVSAGFAILFEDEEIIKHRSTIVGLVGATCFLFDGLVLKGRKLGAGIDRYMAYNDIDQRRLSIGMGLTGLVMAGGNSFVAWAFSTDAWLIYTTFLDIPVSMALVLWTVSWARKGGKAGPGQALAGA